MLKLIKKNGSLVIFFCLLFISFFYRVQGIFENHPFWVDEFSTANQARLVLKYGVSLIHNPAIHFETQNGLYHFLIAGFYKFFGQSESATRLPSVIIGSFIPVLLFLLGKKIFNFATGIAAGIFATTSYFLITWSQQARSYVFLQFIILLTTLLYFRMTDQKKYSRKNVALLFLFFLFGFLLHSFFYIFILALIGHFLLTNRQKGTKWLRKPFTYVGVGFIIFIAYITGFAPSIIAFLQEGLIKANNLWYYHSYLWREYSLITFLSLLGLTFAYITRRSFFLFIFIYLILHLVFISLLFRPYVSRYLLPLWPFILLLASYALCQIADTLAVRLKKAAPTSVQFLVSSLIISTILACFIVGNGHKFTIKPKPFYSVNHDFREIALIDYQQIYRIIKEKGRLNENKTAVIDTWYDRLYWFLGQDYPQAYLFRWIDEEGTTNGLVKKTDFIYNSNGEKIIPRAKNLGFIGELSDLKRAMKKYSRGFIFIDDATMSKEVIEYADKNFKKELYLDHFPLDDNPLSHWPATLYSWGID